MVRVFDCQSQSRTSTEVKFKEKPGVWVPMLELTITLPFLIVGPEVQLPTLTVTNTDKCFPGYQK
jgi:hypothetical protein